VFAKERMKWVDLYAEMDPVTGMPRKHRNLQSVIHHLKIERRTIVRNRSMSNR
jgi:hypothetical protein